MSHDTKECACVEERQRIAERRLAKPAEPKNQPRQHAPNGQNKQPRDEQSLKINRRTHRRHVGAIRSPRCRPAVITYFSGHEPSERTGFFSSARTP